MAANDATQCMDHLSLNRGNNWPTCAANSDSLNTQYRCLTELLSDGFPQGFGAGIL